MSFPQYPEYKDSGVEWLGEVPAHWDIKPLKYVATYNDEVLSESTPDDYPIKYVEISDVDEQLGITNWSEHSFSSAPSRARRILRDGDVLISTVRTYLRAIAPVVEPPENLVGSTGFAAIRPMRGVYHSALLGYALRAEWFISNIIARSVGVSYPAINASDLVALLLPVPPWKEQQAIAAFLDHETARIDALVEEQQRLIELLKEKRQAVISHAATKGLEPDVPMKDSGVGWLGEVPAHWEVRKLSSVTDKITNGYVGPTRGIFFDDGIPYLQSLHIKNNEIKFTPEYYVSKEWSDAHAKSILRSGDVLVVQTGDIGQVAVVPEGFPEANCHALIIVSAIKKLMTGDWLAWVLDSDYGYNSLLSIKTGALHPHLNCGYVKDIYVPVPPLEEQSSIVKYVAEQQGVFLNLISEAESMICYLKERRSALISAAVTGKIDVRGWQPPAGSSARSEVAHTEAV